MPVTLTDVAAAAGVSLATASRAFKEPERLAATTLQRVFAAAAELKYDILPSSRRLTLAVVVPDAANPVFATLITAIQEQVWTGRHRMILANTAEDRAREAETLRTLKDDVDGIFLLSPRLSQEETVAAIGATPVVAVNAAYDFCSTVQIDGDVGIQQSVEHLFALGHRHIAYVPGPAEAWANTRRQASVEAACESLGIKLSTGRNQGASIEGGLAAAASVVASGATAAVCYNDLVALGVRYGIQGLGRQCPQDLSVVGIDDLSIAAVAGPGLSTIRVHITEAGSQAFDLLIDHLTGRRLEPATIHNPSQFIVRASTGPAPQRE